MLLIVSPAKTLDYETPSITTKYTQPAYLTHSQALIQCAQQYSVSDISRIMAVSDKIARLNVQRFAEWHTPFTPENAKQAVLAFKGDVYSGLDAETLTASDFQFAQKHLRILSGLYGLLKPLDLMQAYRLEMGRKIVTRRGKNLYEFWGDIITEGLNKQLKKNKSHVLLNLASVEYFKAVKPQKLNAQVITPVFKDKKAGEEYKIIGVYAKKARGLMARYIIQNQILEAGDIKEFAVDGYQYNDKLSMGNNWVFSRAHS